MIRRRRWRWWLAIPVTLVVALVVTYFSLNKIMGWVTQRRLDKLEGVRGTIDHVEVTLLPPGYDVYDLTIRELPLRKGQEPIAYAQRIEMKWEWRELVKLRLVRKIKIWHSKIVIHARPHEEAGKEQLARQAKRKLPPPTRVDTWLESKDPFRLERVEMIDDQLLVIDHRQGSQPLIWVHDIQATLENLASRRNLTYGKPTLVTGRAMLQRTGKLDLFVSADPLDRGLTFAGQARLRELQLHDLYEMLQAKTGLKIPKGTFDGYASFTCTRGLLTGGIKPILKNVDVQAADPGLGAKIKALLADAAISILSDRVPGRNAVATIIPIHGDLRKPELQLVPAVLAVIRNAFVEGLSASLTDVPPPEAGKKEGILRQARRALSHDKEPPVKAQPEEKR